MEVLPNTLLKPFGTLVSCRDTVDSECIRHLTRDECVRYCENNPFCSCGYFLEPKKGESYCVPLNSALLKNMNLHLNTFPLEKEPTSQLWQSSAVFFRPNIYPMKTDTTTIIMQKDICNLHYHYKGSVYYMQNDFTFYKNAQQSAARILFIDKFPQFYELANTLQNYSTFVIKLFAQPKVLSIIEGGELGAIPYLTLSGEQNVPDLTLYMPGKMKNPLDYKVLELSSSFQILTNNRKSMIGIRKVEKNVLKMGLIPFNEKNLSKGYFQVSRVAVQPNIYKVAEILPARLVFLRNSVDFPKIAKPTKAYIILAFVFMCLLVVLMIILAYLRRRKEIVASVARIPTRGSFLYSSANTISRMPLATMARKQFKQG